MTTWDSLETEARGLNTKARRCGAAVMITDIGNEFGDAARDSVIRTLANHRLTTTSIREALGCRLQEGMELPSVYTLNRHRNGSCSCKGES